MEFKNKLKELMDYYSTHYQDERLVLQNQRLDGDEPEKEFDITLVFSDLMTILNNN